MNNDGVGNQGNNNYRMRSVDQYKTTGAYSEDNSYAKRSPYEEDGNEGGLGVCAFWFQMKVKMQELMSSDIGLQAEERIVTMDTDPFKIWLAWKMSIRSFSNLFMVPFMVIGFYILYIKSAELFTFIIGLLLVLYIMWVLYCPGHQTYTAGAYAIHKNTISLYKAWRVQFKLYQTITILGFLFGSLAISGVAYFPEIYNIALNYIQMAFDYIHYPVQIGKVDLALMKRTAMSMNLIVGITIFLYFIFSSYLVEKAKEERESFKRKNITNRTNSILAQRKSILRGIG